MQTQLYFPIGVRLSPVWLEISEQRIQKLGVKTKETANKKSWYSWQDMPQKKIPTPHRELDTPFYVYRPNTCFFVLNLNVQPKRKKRESGETRETESPPTSGMIVSDGQCMVHAKSTLLGDQARQWAYHPTKMQSPFFQQLARKKNWSWKWINVPHPPCRATRRSLWSCSKETKATYLFAESSAKRHALHDYA